MKICKICNQYFTPCHNASIFCSVECRKNAKNKRQQKYMNAKRKSVKNFCTLCKTEIARTEKSRRKKYCEECAKRLHIATVTSLLRIKRNSTQERHSGQKYENSSERLEEIKNKYKNGVTAQDIEVMVRSF